MRELGHVTEVSAHELARTRLCDQPGCPDDAETGADRCHAHRHAPRRRRAPATYRPDRAPKGVARTEILALLARGQRSLCEISRYRGVGKESTLASLRSLIAAGLVVRVDRGVYALAESLEEAA